MITELGGIKINYEEGADFPLSIDGNFLYPSDIDELYKFITDVVYKNNVITPVIETNPIGEDYVILGKAMYRDKNGENKTSCCEWINGFKIYYTHKDNIHSR